jgi:cytochrome c oxidase assembly protein subunit 15
VTDQAPSIAAASSGTSSTFVLLVNVSLLLVLMVVVLSAYIRLANTGLGCADWPACYGRIDPAFESASALEKTLPADWAGTVHRLAATLLGLTVIGMALIAWRNRKTPGHPLRAPLLLFALTVFLSVLGYSTPSSLVPLITVANLLGGLLMLALLWWLSIRTAELGHGPGRGRLRPAALVALVLLALQLFAGGWLSANFAAASCASFPLCEGAWWPSADWQGAFDPMRVLAYDANHRILVGADGQAIHMLHRYGALLLAVYLAGFGSRLVAAGGRYRRNGIVLLLALSVQLVLGAAAVVQSMPLGLVVAHNVVAAFLLLLMVNIYHLSLAKRVG